MSDKGYSYTGTGTNSQGNHWCSRSDNATGSSGYHYSNSDGSYYYQNTNGSTYYNNDKGYSSYSPPGGKSSSSVSKSK